MFEVETVGAVNQHHFMKVVGSKGDFYTITRAEFGFGPVLSCTCPGFHFRGKCKHVEMAKTAALYNFDLCAGREHHGGKCECCEGDVIGIAVLAGDVQGAF